MPGSHCPLRIAPSTSGERSLTHNPHGRSSRGRAVPAIAVKPCGNAHWNGGAGWQRRKCALVEDQEIRLPIARGRDTHRRNVPKLRVAQGPLAEVIPRRSSKDRRDQTIGEHHFHDWRSESERQSWHAPAARERRVGGTLAIREADHDIVAVRVLLPKVVPIPQLPRVVRCNAVAATLREAVTYDVQPIRGIPFIDDMAADRLL